MEEYFDVLDENGVKTGETKARSLVHKDGDWHATVRVWVIDKENRILLQKRSMKKDKSPGVWDISCAGHLSHGEKVEETLIKELHEELGIAVAPIECTFLGTLKTPREGDNQFENIFVLKKDIDVKDIVIQTEEVDEVKFVTLDEFKIFASDARPGRRVEYDLLISYLESVMSGKRKADVSYGIIPLRGSDPEFLLIHRKTGWWGFPKGHKDEGESDLEAAKREFQEETGISQVDVREDVKFLGRYNFTFNGVVYDKTVLYFLGYSDEEPSVPEEFKDEIQDARWCSFEEARKLFGKLSTVELLKEAYDLVKKS